MSDENQSDLKQSEALNKTYGGTSSNGKSSGQTITAGQQDSSNKRRDGEEGEEFSPRKDSKTKRRKISFQGFKQFSIGLLEFKRRKSKNSLKETKPMTRHVSMDNIHCKRHHSMGNSFSRHSMAVHPISSTSDLSQTEDRNSQQQSASNKKHLFRSFHGKNGMHKDSSVNKSTEDFMKMLDRCEADTGAMREYSIASDINVSDIADTLDIDDKDLANGSVFEDQDSSIVLTDSARRSSSDVNNDEQISNRFNQQVNIDNASTPTVTNDVPHLATPAIVITHSSISEEATVQDTSMDIDQDMEELPSMHLDLDLKFNFDEIKETVQNSTSEPDLSVRPPAEECQEKDTKEVYSLLLNLLMAKGYFSIGSVFRGKVLVSSLSCRCL